MTESNDHLLDSLTNQFKKWIYMKSTEATIHLCGHKPDDHAIVLKQCEKQSWSPDYGDSEKISAVFRKWFKDIVELGKNMMV
jgi:hypothetical protein